MGGKIILLLLLIFPVNVIATANISYALFSDSSKMISVSLEGNDTLLMPRMSFPEDSRCIELFENIPVYCLGQLIIGSLSFSLQNASNISVCISPFDLSSHLSGHLETGSSSSECAEKILASSDIDCATDANDTERKPFQLFCSSGGVKSLNFFDDDKSSLLISIPLLITEGQTFLEVPSIVGTEEPFIQVVMNTTVPGNHSKFFAAILISRNNYENASLDLAKNKTTNDLELSLSMYSKSLQIKVPPKISSELLMGLLPLLPANSAIGLQESTQQGADLILLPDKSWEKGEYILTGCIYSPGKGLIGIKQKEVLII